MASPEQFSRRMANLAFRVKANGEEAVKKTALAIDATLVRVMPVDTGRARSNVLASIAVPRREVVEPRSPEATIGEAHAAVASYKSGQAIYITNNVPYLEKLNRGSSAQAPANFIERAIQHGAQVVRQQRLLK